jgi:translation initiation factor eIF-2B subunit epsilon
MPPKTQDSVDQPLQAVVLAHDLEQAFRPLQMSSVELCGRTILETALEGLARAGCGEILIAGRPEDCFEPPKLLGRDGREVKIQHVTLAGCTSEGDYLRELDRCGSVKSDPFILLRGDCVVALDNLLPIVEAHKKRKKTKDADATLTVLLADGGMRAPTLRPLTYDPLELRIDGETSRILGWYGGGNARDRTAFENGFLGDESYAHECTNIQAPPNLVDCGVDVCSLEVLFRYSENFDYQSIRGDFLPTETGNAELGQRAYAHVLKEHEGRAGRVYDPRILDTYVRDLLRGWFAPALVAERPLSTVDRSAQIVEPSYVGQGATLEASVVVDQSSIAAGCVLRQGARVRGSHLGPRCIIEKGASVDCAVLGARVTVKAGISVPRGCVVGDGFVINEAPPAFSRLPVPEDSDSDEDDDMALGALGNVEALQSRARATSWPPNSDDEGNESDEDWDIDEAQARAQKASDTLFTSTVREMILAGDRNGSAVESLIMEVNCYKLSENRSFRDAAPAALEAVVELAFAGREGKGACAQGLVKAIARWKPLLAKLLSSGAAADERFAVDALEELSKTRPPLNEPDVFALALQKLYEHDVLSDEGILAWGASSTSPLRNSPQVGQLLAFLEDDDEDESSEEGSD